VRELPTGTVTLLFTDIACSTRLVQDVADARRRFEESLGLAHGVGDSWEAGRALSSLAQL